MIGRILQVHNYINRLVICCDNFNFEFDQIIYFKKENENVSTHDKSYCRIQLGKYYPSIFNNPFKSFNKDLWYDVSKHYFIDDATKKCYIPCSVDVACRIYNEYKDYVLNVNTYKDYV